MGKIKANYTILEKYTENSVFDEKKAVLSHFIQLQNSEHSENYKNILLNNGIDIKSLPSKQQFNADLNVPLLYQ